MEDNSYVSLSLQKYNELYDKAKKFDELTEKFGDELSETINTMIKNINEIFTNDKEEHTGETTVEPVEEELKVGDKVNLIKLSDTTYGFNLGDICTINDLNACGYFPIEIDNGISIGYVSKENIKKIKEEK